MANQLDCYVQYDQRLDLYRWAPWDGLRPVHPFLPSSYAMLGMGSPAERSFEADCLESLGNWRFELVTQSEVLEDPLLVKLVNKVVGILNDRFIPNLREAAPFKLMRLDPSLHLEDGGPKDVRHLRGVAALVAGAVESTGHYRLVLEESSGCIFGRRWTLMAQRLDAAAS